jgi:hypothetical protein
VGSTFNPLFVVGDSNPFPLLVPAGIVCAFRDLQGDIWMAGPPGLWQSRGGQFQPVALPTEALHGDIQAFARSADGDLWVAVRTSQLRALFRRHGGTWRRFETPGSAQAQMPTVITTDSSGRTWIGYPDGRVVRVQGDSTVLLIAETAHLGSITAIHVHGEHVWLGGSAGLLFWDGSRLRIFGTRNAPIRGITGIVETATGELWLNGADGITHIYESEVRRGLREADYRAGTETFNYLDGLDGSAPQLRPLPSAILGTNGRIWFTTEASVAWMDPARIERNVILPPVQIRSIEAGGKNYTASALINLPAHTSDLHFSYTALSLGVPERVRFRYQLV